MAGAVHESGESSFKDGWGGWRTSASTGGLWTAGSAGAAGALAASLRGVSSTPWAWSFSRALAIGRPKWLLGHEGRNLRPLLGRGLEVAER